VRVVVTGATGFVASHLLPALADDGHEVVAVGHDRARIPSLPGVEPVLCDLGAPFAAGDLPRADAIVHLAQANVRFPDGADGLFAVNVASTQRLLEIARTTGATHFVFASSGSVYGMADEVLTESSPLAARDFYGATKMAAERLVSAYADLLATTVIRLFVPYGPGQTGRMIPAIAGRVRGGEAVTLNGGGRPRMNPVYVADVVAVVRRGLQTTAASVINVAGPDVVDVRGLAEAIGAVVGRAPVFEEGSATVGGDIVAANDLMQAFLGSTPLTPLAVGLDHMLGDGDSTTA